MPGSWYGQCRQYLSKQANARWSHLATPGKDAVQANGASKRMYVYRSHMLPLKANDEYIYVSSVALAVHGLTSKIAAVLTATCMYAALSPLNRWLHHDEGGTFVNAPGRTHPRVWRRRRPGEGGRVPLLYGFQVILGLLRRSGAQTLQNI